MHSGVHNFMDVKELVPTVKVGEVPPNTVIKVEHETHGYYEVEINTKYEPRITISLFLGSDSGATIKFYNPNPEASIESLVRDAITLIEKYRPKKTTEP